MLQKLSIAFAQGKAGNTSENFWIKIKKIISAWYQEKKIAKKV